MSLQTPNLDTRSFADLVREARDRIPRFTPDWTNLNDADPGMTLVKLQAWLTETLLYEVNRVPELNYIKFLQLLNVRPMPARAARTELHFTLKKLKQAEDPLQLWIPKNAQIEADDPDLSESVIFETDRTLTALNAALAAIIVSDGADEGPPLSLVTRYDADKVATHIDRSFYPLGQAPDDQKFCLIGLLLRPHAPNSQDIFPRGELDLSVSAVEVFESAPDGATLAGPLGGQAKLPHELGEAQAALIWQAYMGSEHDQAFISTTDEGWTKLQPPVDETAALSRSGHLRPTAPGDLTPLSFFKMPREFWQRLGLTKPPTTLKELLDDLHGELQLPGFDVIKAKAIAWEELFPEADLTEVIGNCESLADLAEAVSDAMSDTVAETHILPALEHQHWLDLDAGYSDPAVPEHPMYWLRVKLAADPEAYTPHLLNGFFLNTVPATAAVTRIEEGLGHSDGRPAQSFSLSKHPVYFDPQTEAPDLQLDVIEADRPSTWTAVTDFFGADAHSQVYRLDPITGTVTFGDGIHGRIPVAGAHIVARRYRVGGGAHSNVGAHSVSKLKTRVSAVDSVTNPRAAVGGADAESPERTQLRAPHELRVRDRAVTADDFAVLAKQTPGVPVHTAYALARRALADNGSDLQPRDGAVTLVVLPNHPHQQTPQPSEAQIRALCQYLNPRRLITTELFVTGPRYTPVESLALEVHARQSADLGEVSERIHQTLLDYFHPLHGGDQGHGWPFGEAVYLGNVYERLLALEGVKRVVNLRMQIEGVPSDACDDRLPLAEGHLLHLRRDRIQLQVIYDPR